MSVSGVRSSVMVREMTRMRDQLDNLQIQISTGMKSQNYADLGTGRVNSLYSRSKLTQLEAFDQANQNVNLKINVMQTTLSRITSISSEQKTANLDTSYKPTAGAQTAPQVAARSRLDEIVGLLNQDLNGTYLFSGRASQGQATVSSSAMLDGEPPKAGLATLVTERLRADTGSDGMGRMSVTGGAGSVTLSETASGPFGIKISGVSSSLGNAGIVSTATSPKSEAVTFSGVPVAGESISYGLTMPDGSTTTLKLTAVSGTAGEGEFTIGADATATATNMQTALTDTLKKLVKTELVSASAMAAGDDFFNVDASHPPQRVNGTPETATSLRNGTASDTVIWYTGDNATDNARSTASARVDNGVTIAYGVRANEPGIRDVMKNLAVFAATTIDSTSDEAVEAYASLSSKVRSNLAQPKSQTVTTIQAQVTVAQASLKHANERHASMKAVMADIRENAEGVQDEAVAAAMLSLKTSLEASYQTTSMLSSLSLVKYL